MHPASSDDDSSASSITSIAEMFMWMDNDRVKVVSKEGIEKIVDIRDGFKEISYAAVPLFKETL
jgi:hypothetical protein